MRILQLITRSEIGGAQSVARGLCEGLSARGHELILASGPEGGGQAWQGLPDSIALASLPHLVRRLAPARDLLALAEISGLYARLKPDIIHLHTSKAAALGRLAPGRGRAALVYTMHGYDQLRVSNRKFLAIDRALSGAGAKLVAVSAQDRAAMKADGYPEPIVIPNGVLSPASGRDDEAARSMRRLREKGLPIVLCLARDAPPKRPDLFIQAASILRGKASFAWAGNTGHYGSSDVSWLGAVEGAASLWPLADIACLASDHEGLPMSVLEAMAAVLPTVASAVGGIPEALSGTCGRAVENDAGAFAAALLAYIEDEGQRKAAGAMAKARWAGMYSASAMADAYESLYETLLARRSTKYGKGSA